MKRRRRGRARQAERVEINQPKFAAAAGRARPTTRLFTSGYFHTHISVSPDARTTYLTSPVSSVSCSSLPRRLLGKCGDERERTQTSLRTARVLPRPHMHARSIPRSVGLAPFPIIHPSTPPSQIDCTRLIPCQTQQQSIPARKRTHPTKNGTLRAEPWNRTARATLPPCLPPVQGFTPHSN